MTAVVIKFSADWADEFQVECFAVYENTTVQEQSDRIQKRLASGGGYYFGTNEGFEKGDLSIDNYTFNEITDEEYEVFAKVFSKSYTGAIKWGTGTGAFDSAYDDEDDFDEDE